MTCVTATVASVSHAGRLAEATTKADGVLESVMTRLASLPYLRRGAPRIPAGDCTTATNLVAAVFPDAGAPRDTADARYLATNEDGIPGGSFVTRFDQDGLRVSCVARFRRQTGGIWLAPADLAGWDLEVSLRPPAPVLVVDVVVAGGGALRTGRLVREAGVVRSRARCRRIRWDREQPAPTAPARRPTTAYGFSLVELLVATAAAAVVLAAAYGWVWNVGSLARHLDDRARPPPSRPHSREESPAT